MRRCTWSTAASELRKPGGGLMPFFEQRRSSADSWRAACARASITALRSTASASSLRRLGAFDAHFQRLDQLDCGADVALQLRQVLLGALEEHGLALRLELRQVGLGRVEIMP